MFLIRGAGHCVHGENARVFRTNSLNSLAWPCPYAPPLATRESPGGHLGQPIKPAPAPISRGTVATMVHLGHVRHSRSRGRGRASSSALPAGQREIGQRPSCSQGRPRARTPARMESVWQALRGLGRVARVHNRCDTPDELAVAASLTFKRCASHFLCRWSVDRREFAVLISFL